MPRALFYSVLFLSTLVQGVGTSFATTIQDPDMVVLPDPDLAKAPRLGPASATAGVAYIPPALDKADIGNAGCSALNPCALATPARSDVSLAAPVPRQKMGERQRPAHAG